HPPLGKLIISIGIWLFGMNPFGWRVMGTLVGILMIPLTYVFAKRLFGKSEYALLAAFLMSVDFMHFAQTRIATIDSYGVFFIMLMYYYMYRYYSMNFYQDSFRKTLKPLFLSGLFFGIGAASKWIVIYGGAGLALIFFLSLFERYRQWRAAENFLLLPETYANTELRTELKMIRKKFARYTTRAVAWCTLFFVIIPVVIYSLSFLPLMAVPGEEKSIAHLVDYQESMYDYHSKLKATHGFGSPWYEWPLMVRPIWFYSGKTAAAPDQVSSIWSFGNPAVWWVGLAAFIASLVLLKRKKHRGMFVVAVAFFSQFLPWVLVTRLTFIYHYFAMVPFLIFAIVFMCKHLVEKNPAFKTGVKLYAGISLLLFLLFYPVLSGMVVSKGYVDTFLQWFGTWYFYTG
ncbi:MAG: glycosyltransferase family 39 protein, partial [Gorillibacterium sp.]|nr:glycosyltransferase family 39 protein [Gorillibacterium sp.]